MRINQVNLGLLALSVLLGGCNRGPNERVLNQIKAQLNKTDAPEIVIHLNQSIEETVFTRSKESQIHNAMEILGNNFGFRIEESAGRSGFIPVKRYKFTDFNASNITHGVDLRRDGEVVRIRPNYEKEIVIESVLPPRKGFDEFTKSQINASERESAEVMLRLLGDKDPKSTVSAMKTKDEQAHTQKGQSFETNVGRVCKDQGLASAWFVSYRVRERTSLAADSPFWKLADALAEIRDQGAIEKNAAYRATAFFWVDHGKENLKRSLATHPVVAFQSQGGEIVKAEDWKTFL